MPRRSLVITPQQSEVMGVKGGIVGLPNAGKSTLFNALTRSSVTAERYPFSTVDPNVGVVPVPDPRLDTLARLLEPDQVIPTTIELVDIAGLVEGASHGEGLGNQFLHHIRETDAILHVVRCFSSPQVAHVTGRIDPIADIDTIDTELALADLETVSRALEKSHRRARAGDSDAATEVAALQAAEAQLASGRPARALAPEQTDLIAGLLLLTAKPVLFVANVDEEGLVQSDSAAAVAAHARRQGAEVVVVAAQLESELAALDPDEQEDMLAAYGLDESSLDRVVRAAYELLGLCTFFSTESGIVQAWTVSCGATAPEAAGRIHTDFERGFVRAEVMSLEDATRYGGEHGARDAGRLRVEGRDYVVADGDVIRFRFNV